MRRLRMLGVFGSALAGVTLAIVLAGPLSTPRAEAGGGTISVGAATVAVGGEGTVSLQSLSMAAPGLGAWSMNIVYDPALVQQTGCAPQSGSVCNPNFAPNTIRVTGASANGLVGNATLATFTFRCIGVGTSALTVTTDTLADATPGDPQDITAGTTNGSVTCLTPSTPSQPGPTTAAPPTATPVASGGPNAGFGPGGTNGTVLIWLVAGLAGAGVAWLSAGLAGAGLAAVTGSSAGRRPARPTGFLPHMRPPAGRKQPDTPPKSNASDHNVPSFRPLDRPDRER